MAKWDVLPRAFYDRDPVLVAQALLGQQLVREHDDGLGACPRISITGSLNLGLVCRLCAERGQGP